MRPSSIAGLVLLVAGILILVQGGTFTTRHDVLEVGGLKVSATERRPIAPWLAGAAILGGVTLLLMSVNSARSRPRS